MARNRKQLKLITVLIALFAGACMGEGEKGQHKTETFVSDFIFENNDVSLTVTAIGGMFTDFHLKSRPVNPFGWYLLPEQMPENNQPHVFAGHFLCSGRWGAPSEGEIAAGVPHNGEVHTTQWIITRDERDTNGLRSVTMSCHAPIERLDVEREIIIPEKGGWFFVNEKFTNNLPVGRIANFVQHGTVYAPFLSEEMLVFTNAGKGFDQRTHPQFLEDSSFVWPRALLASGNRINLTNPKTGEGFVTTHIFPETDSLGWVAAINPAENLLLAYVFKTAEYPWFNYWHHAEEGKPYVRGLEFGTTGLGEAHEMIFEENNRFFATPFFLYMDAGEVVEKSWYCFKIETEMMHVSSVFFRDDTLIIAGKDRHNAIVQVEIDVNGR